jgi:hypothetical protein
LVQQGFLVIPVFLSGNRRRIFEFLVDTRSEIIVVSSDIASVANLMPVRPVALTGFGGTATVTACLLDELKVVDITHAKKDDRYDLLAIVDDRVKRSA